MMFWSEPLKVVLATILGPAVEQMRASGVDMSGPCPADMTFVRAARGEFGVVIACYLSQGLIPVKLLVSGHAVNVTLGLHIVRTAVDHGTAFEIAGKGVADATSLVEATLLAARLAVSRRTGQTSWSAARLRLTPQRIHLARLVCACPASRRETEGTIEKTRDAW